MNENQMPIEQFEDPETSTQEQVPANLQEMTEEEALKDLGMEKAPIYQGLDEILQSRSPLAGKIVEFLKETYPEQMPILLATHELEPLLDQRISEAKAMFNQLHPIYQKRENVAQLDTMERIRTENQIAAVIWEEINREILYRPLSF